MSEDNSKVIILVEDEADIRDVYAEMLKSSGYKVLEAADGQTAMNLLRMEQWDLLLLDIMLPGEDGMHILREVKANPEMTRKPVVLLTNLSNETFIAECFDMGASGYLVKSEVDPGKIVSEVENYIGG